jgi:hypothetical protein
VFDTTLWLKLPVLRQQMAVPGATERVPLVNEKSTMFMTVSPAWHTSAAWASGTRAAAGTKPNRPKSARASGLRISHRHTARGGMRIAAGNVRPDP